LNNSGVSCKWQTKIYNLPFFLLLISQSIKGLPKSLR
jgi:hypothetical protein